MRRIIKTKQVMVWRHHRCVERRRLVAGFISDFMAQSDYPKSCQESVRYTSIALCDIGPSVILPLPLSIRCLYVPLCKDFCYHCISRENHKDCVYDKDETKKK